MPGSGVVLTPESGHRRDGRNARRARAVQQVAHVLAIGIEEVHPAAVRLLGARTTSPERVRAGIAASSQRGGHGILGAHQRDVAAAIEVGLTNAAGARATERLRFGSRRNRTQTSARHKSKVAIPRAGHSDC